MEVVNTYLPTYRVVARTVLVLYDLQSVIFARYNSTVPNPAHEKNYEYCTSTVQVRTHDEVRIRSNVKFLKLSLTFTPVNLTQGIILTNPAALCLNVLS